MATAGSHRWLRRSGLLIVIYMLASMVTVCSAVAVEDSEVWRSRRVCGLNCVYLMLRASGKSPDYKLLREALLEEDLSSLQDLKELAGSHGVPLRLASFGPSDLAAATKPVIAHLDLVSMEGGVGGHFVLVTATSEGHVEFVDGTTVMTKSISWRDFQKKWSGYVAHRRIANHWKLNFFAFVVGAGCGLMVDQFRRRNAVR